MDYSLLLYVVIKPYKEVKSHLAENQEPEVNVFKSIDRVANTNFSQKRNTITSYLTPNTVKRIQRAKRNSPASPEEESKEGVHTRVRRLSDVLDMENTHKLLSENRRYLKEKVLYMSESVSKNLTAGQSYLSHFASLQIEKPMLVFKEKKYRKLRIYHICNVNDITNVKALDYEEKMRVGAIKKGKLILYFLLGSSDASG